MSVSDITKEKTSAKTGLIAIAILFIVIVCALIFKPADGYYATFWSLIPPIIAIVLAIITKEVYSSLFVGILFGAILWGDFNFEATINHVVTDGFVASLADPRNVGILVFIVVLGMFGDLMFRAGGTKAYGEWALQHIHSRKMAQLATFFIGVLIFVDDYFNCLTVGSIMRPLTDKFKVSRAKLAYLIDSTAAPICIIAPVSSWAAAVASSLSDTKLPPGVDAMRVFIECIPYNYYAILTITMIIAIILLDLDFGPMKVHEDNAVNNGDLYTTPERPYMNVQECKTSKTGHLADLVIPVFIFLIPSCIVGLLYTGGFFNGVDFVTAFSNCNAAVGLSIGSVIALLITIVYFVIRRAADFPVLMDALPGGFRNMVPAILILIFAWTLCSITGNLGSSEFVSDALKDAGTLSNFLPAIFMLLACFIAFATGTSWGTMGILLPIVVPVFYNDYSLMIVGISACMAGAVFGNHCSPISDTTIMSSAGAQCSHVNHVATQVPYGLFVAGISFVFFLISGFFQTPFMFIIAAIVMIALLYGIKMYTANKGDTIKVVS